MKLLIGEYGKALLAMTVLLFIVGLSGMLLIGAESMTKDASRESDEMYRKIRERKEPEIRYRNCPICAGCPLEWTQMFEAEDADGEKIEFSILTVDGRKEEPASYRFPKSGIYEVEVSAEDRYGIISIRTFCIPVQRAVWGKEKVE